MNNIWELLLQAISVSVTAGIILIIKRLLLDKLSPRWQYGVWCILALRILIPANTISYIFQPVPLWIEAMKGIVENNLDSAYTNIYETISPDLAIPLITGLPVSITDILFVVIFAGTVAMLIYYLISYIRLRMILKTGTEISTEMREIIDSVSEKYSLHSCRTVSVRGLDAAFISGVFKPVLAVPYGEILDEKIILHELMHLKYYDGLQNIFWSILKAVNWYNPFMWYIFNIIGNDMESLCDQRVLEVLEGEERRAYGAILLNMVNDRYSRAVGTSSISNGGKNITRRIESIVRFKKYPKGMAVVSVCIAVILMFSVLGGQTMAYGADYYRPSYEQIEYAMALARTNRCNTVAGAVDMYAKGLMQENGIMIACASSFSKHEEMENAMRKNSPHEQFLFDSGYELDYVNISEGYRIYNLEMQDDGSFTARLLIHTNGIRLKNSNEWLSDESGESYKNCCVSIGLRIYKEDAWCVEEYGERRIETNYLNLYQPPFELVDSKQDMTAVGETGTVSIMTYVEYGISNTIQNTNGFWNSSYFNTVPNANAVFSYADAHFYCIYDTNTRTTGESPENTYGIQIIAIDSPDEKVQWPETEMTSPVSGVNSDGFNWAVNNVREWDDDAHESVKESYGKLQVGSSGNREFDPITGEVDLHKYFKARIFWDGQPVEEMTLVEAQ